MSNFSFIHNVFKNYLLLMRQNEYLWSVGLQLQVSPGAFGNQHFLLFPQCFLSIPKEFLLFSHIYFVVGKWYPAFSPFSTMFSIHTKKNFCCSVTFILSSANAFNLDQSKISSFGKEFMQCSAVRNKGILSLYSPTILKNILCLSFQDLQI